MSRRSVLTDKGREILESISDCRRHLAGLPDDDLTRAIDRLADAVERLLLDSEPLWMEDGDDGNGNGNGGESDDNGNGGGQVA